MSQPPGRIGVSAEELRELPTIIDAFVRQQGDGSRRTFGELVEIFALFLEDLSRGRDPSNDGRIALYEAAMAGGVWSEPIEICRHAGLVCGGIHRGVAYLRCIERGIPPEELPDVFVVDR